VDSVSGPPEKFEKYSFSKQKNKFSFEGVEEDFRGSVDKLKLAAKKIRKKKNEA
jgi:hypothetical protein